MRKTYSKSFMLVVALIVAVLCGCLAFASPMQDSEIGISKTTASYTSWGTGASLGDWGRTAGRYYAINDAGTTTLDQMHLNSGDQLWRFEILNAKYTSFSNQSGNSSGQYGNNTSLWFNTWNCTGNTDWKTGRIIYANTVIQFGDNVNSRVTIKFDYNVSYSKYSQGSLLNKYTVNTVTPLVRMSYETGANASALKASTSGAKYSHNYDSFNLPGTVKDVYGIGSGRARQQEEINKYSYEVTFDLPSGHKAVSLNLAFKSVRWNNTTNNNDISMIDASFSNVRVTTSITEPDNPTIHNDVKASDEAKYGEVSYKGAVVTSANYVNSTTAIHSGWVAITNSADLKKWIEQTDASFKGKSAYLKNDITDFKYDTSYDANTRSIKKGLMLDGCGYTITMVKTNSWTSGAQMYSGNFAQYLKGVIINTNFYFNSNLSNCLSPSGTDSRFGAVFAKIDEDAIMYNCTVTFGSSAAVKYHVNGGSSVTNHAGIIAGETSGTIEGCAVTMQSNSEFNVNIKGGTMKNSAFAGYLNGGTVKDCKLTIANGAKLVWGTSNDGGTTGPAGIIASEGNNATINGFVYDNQASSTSTLWTGWTYKGSGTSCGTNQGFYVGKSSGTANYSHAYTMKKYSAIGCWMDGNNSSFTKGIYALSGYANATARNGKVVVWASDGNIIWNVNGIDCYSKKASVEKITHPTDPTVSGGSSDCSRDLPDSSQGTFVTMSMNDIESKTYDGNAVDLGFKFMQGNTNVTSQYSASDYVTIKKDNVDTTTYKDAGVYTIAPKTTTEVVNVSNKSIVTVVSSKTFTISKAIATVTLNGSKVDNNIYSGVSITVDGVVNNEPVFLLAGQSIGNTTIALNKAQGYTFDTYTQILGNYDVTYNNIAPKDTIDIAPKTFTIGNNISINVDDTSKVEVVGNNVTVKDGNVTSITFSAVSAYVGFPYGKFIVDNKEKSATSINGTTSTYVMESAGLQYLESIVLGDIEKASLNVTLTNNNEDMGKVTYTINGVKSTNFKGVEYGDVIELTATPNAKSGNTIYSFANWMVDGNQMNTSAIVVVAKEDMNITANFVSKELEDNTQYYNVVFRDFFNNIYNQTYIAKGAEAQAQIDAYASALTYNQTHLYNTFSSWYISSVKDNGEDIQVIEAWAVLAPTQSKTVTINGATYNLGFNNKIKLNSTARNFVGWAVNNVIVSYERSYEFAVLHNDMQIVEVTQDNEWEMELDDTFGILDVIVVDGVVYFMGSVAGDDIESIKVVIDNSISGSIPFSIQPTEFDSLLQFMTYIKVSDLPAGSSIKAWLVNTSGDKIEGTEKSVTL